MNQVDGIWFFKYNDIIRCQYMCEIFISYYKLKALFHDDIVT